ncbi:acetamidase/formamidase family protein [Spiribacter roseus]|uniref:acetamidase/formamidase family protein n=1 Tax=Spiribacter roseus TaxID=1855875 RepID=UPI001330BBAD|nr:acetamidase/formamidase family protein [Spiribacter roseus]KAF0282857.1 amidase [Spiribacter roseus]
MPTPHHLPATPDTVAWGYLDAARRAVLQVQSGDEVVIDTLSGEPENLPADPARVLPDHRAVLEAQRKERGEGVHHLTGPIHVDGARPGDCLQIDILAATLRQDWGFCEILPLKGILPAEFTDYQQILIDIDRVRNQATLPWGQSIALDPFFGIMAVAPPPEWGRLASPVPWAFGGNIDNRALVPGTTLYLPVFNDGALFSVGDGHGRQGDGEVCIDALETALQGRFRLTVRRDIPESAPFAETPSHWISMGLHPSLDQAAEQAVRQMVQLLTARTGLDRSQAYMMTSMLGDLRITQVVDGNKGVHMLYPKDATQAP